MVVVTIARLQLDMSNGGSSTVSWRFLTSLSR